MTTQVAPGVHRLGTRWVNWYLVDDGDQLTLVDTAVPKYWDQLPSALASLGRTLDDIDAIVLTHNHSDHVGCAERARSQSGARAYIHPADAAVASGEEKPKAPPGAFRALPKIGTLIFFGHLATQDGMGLPAVAELTPLADGEVLDVPGRPRVIATPGHSPGHCALHLEERGVLLTGDALVTMDFAARTRGPSLLPINDDREQALASLDRLQATGASVVLPGHGAPWKGPAADAVTRARAREAERA